jgi:hypothetical protein
MPYGIHLYLQPLFATMLPCSFLYKTGLASVRTAFYPKISATHRFLPASGLFDVARLAVVAYI